MMLYDVFMIPVQSHFKGVNYFSSAPCSRLPTPKPPRPQLWIPTIRAKGLGFKGLGFRVKGSGFRVKGLKLHGAQNGMVNRL